MDSCKSMVTCAGMINGDFKLFKAEIVDDGCTLLSYQPGSHSKMSGEMSDAPHLHGVHCCGYFSSLLVCHTLLDISSRFNSGMLLERPVSVHFRMQL